MIIDSVRRKERKLLHNSGLSYINTDHFYNSNRHIANFSELKEQLF